MTDVTPAALPVEDATPSSAAVSAAVPLPVSQPKPHLAFLDSLRALAALYVLMHHVYEISKNYHFFDGITSLVRGAASAFSAGHMAVDVFIVLSGFSLMLAVLRKGQSPPFWSFLSRRAQRILPPYYAALAFPIVLHFVTGEYLLQASELRAWPIVAHLLLVHDLFADTWSQINNVLWSVSVEWRIYLLFPFFSYLFLKFGVRVLLLAASVVFLLAVAFCQALQLPQAYALTGICPQYVVLFGLGMACAVLRFSEKPRYASLRERLERVPQPWFWVTFVTLFTVFFLKSGICWKLFGSAGIFALDIIVGVFAAALLFGASYTGAPGTPRGLFSSTRLAGIGLMAYSIYLVHYPVLLLVASFARDYVSTNPMRLLLMYTVGIALAYGGALLFYRFIERPFAIPKKKPLSG